MCRKKSTKRPARSAKRRVRNLADGRVKAGKILRGKLDLMLENDEVDLETVIGPVLTKELIGQGLSSLKHLEGADPEKLYQRSIVRRGRHVDRCVLYTYRCGRYVARTPARQRVEQLLLWYNWTDSKLPENAEELLCCPVERLSQVDMNKRAAAARRQGKGSDGPNKKKSSSVKSEEVLVKEEMEEKEE